ncbi:MAG TPA: hypothetical protein DCY94_02580 [Firmicutes bacterium]|nr:hypothetical protein [Bacillota bacterium]
MDEILDKLKEILESEADLFVEEPEDIPKLSKKGERVRKKTIDHRFDSIKQIIDSAIDKSDTFYTELVRVLSMYLNQLYERDIDFCNVIITNTDATMNDVTTIYFNSSDAFILKRANQELSIQLFKLLCGILENNKDLVLDIETLKRLLDRKPKLFTLSVEESYLDRPFEFDRLAEIIKVNQTLQKSSIGSDEIYQLLVDTTQIDKEEVFINLVKPEDFEKNHEKIDEFLMWCNARTFVAVTRIIRTHFDKNFDRLSIIKQRNKNNFCESVIVALLQTYHTDEDISLIHEILTDKDIKIDYDFAHVDYVDQTDLRTIIAFSGNRTIIRDLLERENNIRNLYWYGESRICLYMLYAIAGDYEKSLDAFMKIYNYEADYTEDFNDDFNKKGYTYGDFHYKDSLVEFLNRLIESFKIDDIEYPKIKELITRVLTNEKVKYVNLEETMSILLGVLSGEDFQNLLDSLITRHNSGNLGFITVTEDGKADSIYTIRLATEEEINEIVAMLNKKMQKSLEMKKEE